MADTIKVQPWRLIYSGDQSGLYNMTLDESILDSVERAESPPTLRLYGWKTPVLSLGYMQNPFSELDFEQIKKDGVEVVRRPTGGRAVLHINEWAYSVIASTHTSPWCQDKSQSYQYISAALTELLSLPNKKLSFHRGQIKTSNIPTQAYQPCFASTSRFEVVAHGKKLVGSAQRRRRGAFLQHGSILCSKGHLGVIQYLSLSEQSKKDYLQVLLDNSITLEDWYGKAVDRSKLAENFLEKFAKLLGVETEIGLPNLAEIQAQSRLLEQAPIQAPDTLAH